MTQSKYLIVKGAAGLGNRLIALCNAIDYAQQTERVLLVDWSDGQFAPKGVNAFPLFFRLKNVESVSTFEDVPDLEQRSSYPPIWKHQPEASVWDFYRLGESTFINHTFLRRVLRECFPRGALRKLQRHWYLYSEDRKTSSHTVCHAMGALFSRNDICVGGDLSFRLEEDLVFFVDYCPQFDPHILLNCIGLAPHMETTIDTFCEENQLRGNCIGIHIRMTDAMPTHPLDRLANRIQRIPLTDPQIFLATDSDTAREYVQSKYSNVIMVPQVQIDLPQGMGRHYYAHRLGFESLAEVIFRESIMDMFLLAQCEYLIAQQNSSFSRVSAVLRDKPSHVSYW